MENDNKDIDYEYIENTYGVNIKPLGEEDSAEPQVNPPEAQPQKAETMELYDWVQCIVGAVIAGILIFVFLVRIIGVIGSSMLPTFNSGDKVIVSNLFFEPSFGDVVIIKTDSYGDEPLIKRVIAVGGQTVDIDFTAGVVYVDGVALQEDYTYTSTNNRDNFSGPLYVPEGYIFVMGDNRNGSTDSRSDRVGLVDTRNVLGKVYFIIIPGKNEITGKREWSRVGGVY